MVAAVTPGHVVFLVVIGRLVAARANGVVAGQGVGNILHELNEQARIVGLGRIKVKTELHRAADNLVHALWIVAVQPNDHSVFVHIAHAEVFVADSRHHVFGRKRLGVGLGVAVGRGSRVGGGLAIAIHPHARGLLHALASADHLELSTVAQIGLAGVADIEGVRHVVLAVVAAVDIVQIVGQVLSGDIGAVVQGVGGQARGGVVKVTVVGNGHAATEQLQAVEVDGEVTHVFLHKRQGEQHAKGKRQHHEGLLQLVHAQQRRADALHAALGHIHGYDRVGVDVIEVLVGQRLLQLLDAHHTAEVAFGLGLAEALAGGGSLLGRGILAGRVLGIGAGCVLRRVLCLALGQILGSLIFVVVTLEQSHGDQILYFVRM